MSVYGRKKASFTKEQLVRLLEKEVSLRQLYFYLGAGDKTIRRKMKEWNLERKPLRIPNMDLGGRRFEKKPPQPEENSSFV